MAFLKRVGGRVVGETPPVLRTRHRPKGQPFTQGSGAPFDARPRLLEIIVTTLGRKEEGIRASLLSRKATAPCAASSVPRPEWKGHGERCTFVAIVLRLFLSLSRQADKILGRLTRESQSSSDSSYRCHVGGPLFLMQLSEHVVAIVLRLLLSL